MAVTTTARRKSQQKSQKDEKKKEEGKLSLAQRKANQGLPRYLQRKLAVGPAGDAYEAEADRVADHVASSGVIGSRPVGIQRAKEPEKKETKAPTPSEKKAVEPPKPADKKPAPPRVQKKDIDVSGQVEQAQKEEEQRLKSVAQASPAVQRRPLEGGSLAPSTKQDVPLRRKPVISRRIQRFAAGDSGGTVDQDTERAIERRRGSGRALPDEVRKGMEERIGEPFDRVRIHDDAEAAVLASSMNAQAFTVGNDIYFNRGRYQPHSAEGQHLLAHELTHVVQQGGAVDGAQRRIEPEDNGQPHPQRSPAARKLRELEHLELPPVKRRHLGTYRERAGTTRLMRLRGYRRGRPGQVGIWRSRVRPDPAKVEQKLERTNPRVELPARDDDPISFEAASRDFTVSRQKFFELLQIPKWDRRGQRVPGRGYQVDHIVELQLSGEHGTGSGNSIENMELLDQPSNSSSGSTIMNGIYTKLREYLAVVAPNESLRDWLTKHDIIFERVSVGTGGSPESESSYWTRQEIMNAEPASVLKGILPGNVQGTPTQFALLTGPGGRLIQRFSHRANETSFAPRRNQAESIKGLVINRITLNDEGGTLEANWSLPRSRRRGAEWADPGPVTISIVKTSPYAGYLREVPQLITDLNMMSPVRFSSLTVERTGVYGEGVLEPTFPLFAGNPITILFEGDDITFSHEFSPESLNSPIPGITFDDATLRVFYSARRGLGLEGMLFFSAGSLGSGHLLASISSDGPAFEGAFSFDTALFDRAMVRVWYRNRIFGGEGTIAIDRPDKIRGIRSAEVTVFVNGNDWALQGSAEPSIPGIEQASIGVRKVEDSLIFDGDVALEQNAIIRSGSIHVTLTKQNESYKVAARGTAQPNVANLDASLSVSYDDGLFSAEATVSHQRDRMSGSITVGVTNAPISEEGRPEGTPEAGADELRLYGSGFVTLRLSRWLEGTAGVRILPNGELEVRGRLGVSRPLIIFDEERWDRQLLSVNFDIPIFGVSVLGQRIGIFCTIGGDLQLLAGVGPAQFRNVAVEVIYNPSHPELTEVTGTAQFYLPADAGLELGVYAGIGAGIPVVSATAGIRFSGKLGLQAHVSSDLVVNWSPANGLSIDNTIEATMQPVFKFGINGFVRVQADLLLKTINLYRKDWKLANYEYGSGYTLGISMPIRYREGQPFNPSFSDVRLTYPNINPRQVLGDIFDRIV